MRTSAGSCTWHEFAQAIFALKGLSPALTAVTTPEFAAKAPRPRYSVLDNAKWLAAGFTPLRPWRDALAAALHGGAVDAHSEMNHGGHGEHGEGMQKREWENF